MDAILNINKPAGMSSFRCVSIVRQIVKEKKAGHGGTLDPEATGILPVCIGKATRCADFFLTYKKRYRAEIFFGAATDTCDIWGEAVQFSSGVCPELFPFAHAIPVSPACTYDSGDLSAVTSERLQKAIPKQVGRILQVPPMYSAIKMDGIPAYKRARRGENVEMKARYADIYEIVLLHFVHHGAGGACAVIEIECGRGTYIRSLCRDLGAALECPACMSRLERIRYGPLAIAEAVTLETLEHEIPRRRESGDTESPIWMYSIDALLRDLPYTELTPAEAARYRNGQPVILPQSAFADLSAEAEPCVRLREKGAVLAVAKIRPEPEGYRLVPFKYFG